MGVVVPPAIDARAECDRHLGHRREDILRERAQAPLRPSGYTLCSQNGVLRHANDAGSGNVTVFLAVAVYQR